MRKLRIKDTFDKEDEGCEEEVIMPATPLSLLVRDLIRIIKEEKPSKQEISKIKTRLSKRYSLKRIPTDIEILLNSPVKDIPNVRRFLLTKPVRTISGVSVCAVMTKPMECPHVKKGVGPCLMCPGGPGSVFGDVPQSYTGKEPATRRAIRNRYDPYLQVMNRLEQHVVQGHMHPDKVELIIMGGTFPSFSKRYRESFVAYAFKAMNDFSRLFFRESRIDIIKFKRFFELPGDIYSRERETSIRRKLLRLKGKSFLKKEQLKNEKSRIRCVSLVIETRPDYATLKEAGQMLDLGCTKVELGVQTIYNDALKKARRGHTVEDSIKATKTLKDLGFKINYHMMLGLPGVSRKKDLFALNSLFMYEEFQPDMLKIYPCMVLKGTRLYSMWKRKRYIPMSTRSAVRLISEFKKDVPEHVRIMRVQRDIPTFMTEAGVDKTNLRQYVEESMKEQGIMCRCIRCREPRLRSPSRKIALSEVHYTASGGNEFFISAEDLKNDMILGFCRLRFPSRSLRKEITEDSALIRELHVYGEAAPIGKKGRIQHKGLGRSLVMKAEETARTYYRKKMVVIAGIGAKPYFAKLGYKKEGPYMVKRL
ncbi:tRNA uridine(34) 5-carboxymethylaminomethyl modification radical SAM/GNAT enzyme Elp3 [Candidatus Woesearchaeota archaeon]|nr:tRNA uridine(34) 5-carboxymethylaminomethyl modification radical SAM/GNAT enzyme Elp3 [Candidatus Woesearchaeota archaeon]